VAATIREQQALWVLRAQCDDREALGLLLESIQSPLHQYLRSLVGPDGADDVLQNVLVLIFRKLVFLEDPLLFRPWAFRIASRAAFRWLTRERKRPEEVIDQAALEDIAAAWTPPSIELMSELHAVDVSPASRAVLVLHFQEDLPLADVAAILEIPLGTVKSRLAYGLAALRRQLSAKKEVLMSHETGDALQRSLNAIDSLRRRVYLLGWIVVAATLGVYLRLAYLHRTSDNLEQLLGASVAALTFFITWVGFAVILIVTRTAKSILRAIDLSTRKGG
jgi:RNA polymerase sigma-70 factor, ECF subfamily